MNIAEKFSLDINNQSTNRLKFHIAFVGLSRIVLKYEDFINIHKYTH